MSPAVVLAAVLLAPAGPPGAIVAHGVLPAAVAAAAEHPEGPRPARPGAICLACRGAIGEEGLAIVHRGREIALHDGACMEVWRERGEALFASLQPRGALFQEPAEPASPLKGIWFLFGLYIVAGLLAGAACGYLAVQRGHPPMPWFFAGLAVNLAALILLLSRPRGDTSALPAGIPPGLAKVPTTRAPRACGSCGAENHPAARSCSACGAPLSPTAEAETSLV